MRFPCPRSLQSISGSGQLSRQCLPNGQENGGPISLIWTLSAVEAHAYVTKLTIVQYCLVLRTLQPRGDHPIGRPLTRGNSLGSDSISSDSGTVEAILQRHAFRIHVPEEFLLTHLCRILFSHHGALLVPGE